MVMNQLFQELHEVLDGHLMTVLLDDIYLHLFELLIKVLLLKIDLVNLYLLDDELMIILPYKIVMIGILVLEILQLIIG